MKKAFVFPGQGSQFAGMGASLYASNAMAKALFEQANSILGFRISDIMFQGSEEDLRRTDVTQPAIFLHSVILAKTLGNQFKPDMVAGHSLGEFSALVAAGGLQFEDGLQLVAERASAMQLACEQQAGTMAAILGLEDALVDEVCQAIEAVVVSANYNCPGQLVISGSVAGVNEACERLKAKGAKRALLLPVGGAFHSPLMEPARERLAMAIEKVNIDKPLCPIYQNVTAQAEQVPDRIRQNLIAQLTAPVRWTATVQAMFASGARHFVEVGPGKVLQGLVKKIAPEAEVAGA